MIKTITVAVQIQMDLKSDNTLHEVKESLELMNRIIGISELECQPQIFVSDITNSDILEGENEFEKH